MPQQTPEGETRWRMYTSRSRRFTPTLADLAGITAEEIERRLANQRGIPIPEAGLPDEEAIEEVFGFTREDLYLDKTRKPYKGKRDLGDLSRSLQEEYGIQEYGRHDESGADEG